MNHKKARTRRNKAKVSFGYYPKNLKRMRRRFFRSRVVRPKRPTHWHYHNDVTFSKNVIKDVELLWLHTHAPHIEVTYEKVHNCESMPLYKSGQWNGMAHFVRFDPIVDFDIAVSFRIKWRISRG